MGKVKRPRQKFHLATKSKSFNDLTEIEEAVENETTLPAPKWSISTENIFAGLEINVDDLQKNLKDEFDTRSLSSVKSRKQLKEEIKHLPKKDKRKLRHESFMRKIDLINQMRKEVQAKKKREKTAIVGDMKPLADALPSLESLFAENSNYSKSLPKPKLKGIEKAGRRKKQLLADVKFFRKILNDKIFKANPTDTITEYLKQKVAQERSEN